MTLYRNKYRIESARLPNYDYSANGYYFVTICTHQKFCYFGDVVNAQMQFSQVGRIARLNWQEIPSHFDGVYLDEYVIMPNHVHGIIVISRPDDVETRYIASLQSNKFAPLKPGSLQAIVHAYKASVTRWCRKHDDDIFRWQPRFYDRIIRDERGLNNVRRYIIDNPAKWTDDRHYVN